MSQDVEEGSRVLGVSHIPVETVMESLPDAVLVADAEGKQIVSVNDAAGDLFDCRPDDLVGRSITELHPSEDTAAYIEAFQRGIESKQVSRLQDGRQMCIETVDGERTPVEINAQRFTAEGQSLVLGVFRDVSSRVERERELKRTTARFRTLLDAMPVPVTVMDSEGTVEVWNRAAEETFGYTAKEVQGDQHPLFGPDREFRQLFETALEDGSVDGHETSFRGKDGSLVTVEVYAQALSEDGDVTGVIGLAVDVTEHRTRARQLDVLQRVMRHNLRNQLNVIRGVAEQIAKSPETATESDLNGTERIRAATDKLLRLSEQSAALSAASEREQDPSAQSELRAVLDSVVETLASHDVAMAFNEVDGSGAVPVPAQAEQALTRLLAHVLERTDATALSLDVRVQQRHVTVEASGETPLLSRGNLNFVDTGHETALKHGDGLDIMHVQSLLTNIGGELTIPDSEPHGRSLGVELPRRDSGGHTPV